MDQSKSSEKKETSVVLPRRRFTIEFFVGLFALAGVVAAGYLAIGLGHIEVGASSKYQIYAEFDNVSGLKNGASVEIGGVQVGEVVGLALKDPQAIVTLRLDRNVKIKDDDIASIRTKGIIGDRYVKISRGGSDRYIPEGGKIVETESVVDLEDVIGKIVHSFTSDKSDEKSGGKSD